MNQNIKMSSLFGRLLGQLLYDLHLPKIVKYIKNPKLRKRNKIAKLTRRKQRR